MNPPSCKKSRLKTICHCTLMVALGVSSALAQTNCVAPPAGMVSWWRAEGNAVDSVSGNNGNFSGPNYAAGEVGLAFNFDGSGNNVRVPASPSMDVGTSGGMTIESWIYSTDSSWARPIVEWVPNTVGAYGTHFYAHQHGPGVLYANLVDTAGNPHMIETPGGLVQTNSYQHVAVTYDKASGLAQLFVNGSLATNSVLGTFTPQTSPDLSIGYRPNTVPFGPIPFIGRIDEVSLYTRALSSVEIQAIYNAGSAGKCIVPTPPSIVAQPTNQTLIVGGSATFSVLAAGTGPLNYQWLIGGVDLPGATTSTLTLTNVQFTDAGLYSVLVSNSVGTATSSNATLVVNKPPPCQAPPAGIVSWWKGENNADDSVGGNNGAFLNNPTYVPGVVGTAFSFNGINQYVEIPDAPSLNPTTNFSLEAWIYVKGNPNTDLATIITKFSPVNPQLNQYQLETHYAGGRLNFRALLYLPSGYGYTDGSTTIQFNNWYHVAMTYDNASLKLYVNGALDGSVAATGAIAPTAEPLLIGGPSSGPWWFNGLVDEVSLYSRALSASEVQSIYAAGAAGKCSGGIPPFISVQPTNQTAYVGDEVSFTVNAGGSAPLSYQWRKNGGLINGETGSTLVLNNVQFSDAGSYSVIVSNVAGTVESFNATLFLAPLPPCQPPPSGLVGWWQAEGNALDLVGGNNGVFQNGPSYVPGIVGQAFSFNGVNQYVEIPDAPSLNPTTNFSLEAWVYVKGNPNTDLATIVTKFSPVDPQLNQYQLETHYAGGRLNFRALLYLPSGYGYTDGSTTIQFNNWYHVAMTYDNASLKLYVNGALDGSVAASGAIAPTAEPLLIGGPSSGPWWFNGLVDEVSLYARALSASEVQSIYAAGAAGKCSGGIPPFISVQPINQTALVGNNVTFSVVAAGTLPLSYQWDFNGTAVSNATNSSLTLSGVTLGRAGSYSVVVTNVAGAITSSPAILTVSLPPAGVQIASVTVGSDGTVIVPVSLLANGNENAVGFTLNFDPTLLTNTGVVLGSGASSASLFPNLHASAGQLGIAAALPAGQTFAAGTQQLVVVTFNSVIVTTATSNVISFSDSVVQRVLADVSGKPLPVTFSAGTIILPPSQLEGDAFPRPNGDGQLTVSDWVLIGRYVAGLDSPTNELEFQKADCAPRETLGDGLLTVSDWVQAGRYVAGLDPITRVGGPTSAVPLVVTAPTGSAITPKTMSSDRQLRLLAPILTPGQTGTLAVELQAFGNENALAFSLNFDPAQLAFTGATPGNDMAGATVNVNDKRVAQGQVAVVLALPANQTFSAGVKQVVQVGFRASATAGGNVPVGFADLPVPRGVSDPNATALQTDYVDAAVTVNPRPVLKILGGQKGFDLSWPASANGFLLQESSDAKLAVGSWTTIPRTPVITNSENVISVPSGVTNKFYRLYHP